MRKRLISFVLLCLLVKAFHPVLAAEPEFTIYGGDVLQITVWKEEGLDREVLVLPNGTITFPLIGDLNVRGMTPAAVQSAIKEKLKPLIPNASVTVAVKAPLGQTVSVLGQVAKPGEFVMGRSMTVTQALSQAGGLTSFASESQIIVVRQDGGQKISIPFPYRDVAKGKNLEMDIALKPGDVIIVPTASLF